MVTIENYVISLFFFFCRLWLISRRIYHVSFVYVLKSFSSMFLGVDFVLFILPEIHGFWKVKIQLWKILANIF